MIIEIDDRAIRRESQTEPLSPEVGFRGGVYPGGLPIGIEQRQAGDRRRDKELAFRQRYEAHYGTSIITARRRGEPLTMTAPVPGEHPCRAFIRINAAGVKNLSVQRPHHLTQGPIC